jgi:molecular chaperone Hsp33
VTTSARGPTPDSLSRFVFERAAVRGAYVRLDHTARAIVARHPYPPALARVIAELSAAAILLAATLEFDGSLIVQLAGDGPVRLLVVECDADLNLRATAQWSGSADSLPPDAPLATLAGGPAHGRLAIMLDPRGAGQIYQGIVALEATSIATLIEHYLSTSEQIESRLLLASQDGATRGVLVQRMPGAGARDDDAWRRASRGVEAVDATTLLEATDAAALLRCAFANDDVRVFPPREARFACSCNPDRVANALRLIGRDEVESILDERGEIGVTCEFCNRAYTFDAAAARGLFGGAAAAATPHHRPGQARH